MGTGLPERMNKYYPQYIADSSTGNQLIINDTSDFIKVIMGKYNASSDGWWEEVYDGVDGDKIHTSGPHEGVGRWTKVEENLRLVEGMILFVKTGRVANFIYIESISARVSELGEITTKYYQSTNYPYDTNENGWCLHGDRHRFTVKNEESWGLRLIREWGIRGVGDNSVLVFSPPTNVQAGALNYALRGFIR